MGYVDCRQREYRALCEETRGGAYRTLLDRARETGVVDPSVSTWVDLFNSPERLRDPVLRPILEWHGRDGEARWRTILLLIFWSSLESIHRNKSWWDPDPDEFWANLQWAFLQVICGFEIRCRSSEIALKIKWDTFHSLYSHYENEWPWTKSLRLEDETYDVAEIAYRDRGFDRVDMALDRDWRRSRLEGMRNRGILTETNFLLLIGTEVYGHSLAATAKDAGLSYEAAKKRRQRALASIRHHLKDLEEM